MIVQVIKLMSNSGESVTESHKFALIFAVLK